MEYTEDRDFLISDKTVVGYYGTESTVYIPEYAEAISEGIFDFTKNIVRCVVCPDKLRTIEETAFACCENLKEVRLPHNLERLEMGVFQNCKALTEIELPEELNYLGWGVFYGCSELQNIVLPEKLTYIGGQLFKNCSSLESVRFDCRSAVIDEKIFAGCSLTLAAKAPHLKPNAFKSSGDKRAACVGFAELVHEGADIDEDIHEAYLGYIRRQKKVLLHYAFVNPSLMQLMLDEGLFSLAEIQKLIEDRRTNTELKMKLMAYSEEHFTEKERKKLAERMLRGELSSAELKKIWSMRTLPDGTLELLSYKGKDNMVYVPSKIGRRSVTRLGDELFSEHKANITFDARIRRMRIDTVVIPEGVTSIGARCFCGCSSLSHVYLPGSLRTIGVGAFEDCYALEDISLPDGLEGIPDFCFQGCEHLETINMNRNISYIGRNAFGSKEVVITAKPGSLGEKYANENGYTFVEKQEQ